MCGHEYKNCPRCKAPFECRAGSIHRCQCHTVTLTAPEREYIHEYFDDCLCASCMSAMKAEYNTLQFASRLKNIMGNGH